MAFVHVAKKHFDGTLPDGLNGIWEITKPPTRITRAALQKNTLVIRNTKNTKIMRSLIWEVPKMWNTLPEEIRVNGTKHSAKNHIFSTSITKYCTRKQKYAPRRTVGAANSNSFSKSNT